MGFKSFFLNFSPLLNFKYFALSKDIFGGYNPGGCVFKTLYSVYDAIFFFLLLFFSFSEIFSLTPSYFILFHSSHFPLGQPPLPQDHGICKIYNLILTTDGSIT